MNDISIRLDNITHLKTDAIVNAANRQLQAGGGVCGIIFNAAGMDDLTRACGKIGFCETGSAVITPGFRLCKYIIHAVGPQWGTDPQKEKKQLYDCYTASLKLAVENGCESIGFPLISAGIFGMPQEIAWKQALAACRDFPGKIRIEFVNNNADTVALGSKLLAETVPASPVPGKPLPADPHQARIAVFNDTRAWIAADPALSASVLKAKKHTRVYAETEYPVFNRLTVPMDVRVTGRRTFEAARELEKELPGKRVAVLNFANAFCPGGGVKKGTSAQEECLCRASTLFPLLYRQSLREPFYDYHRALNDGRATDRVIYTHGVVVCKTDEALPQRMAPQDWYTVDVMTAAAPDLREKDSSHFALNAPPVAMTPAEQFGCHVKRAIHILTVAAAEGADVLVLGAFGCGAFQNDPETVARAYRTALEVFPPVFTRVEFAVYCGTDDTNYRVFKEILA